MSYITKFTLLPPLHSQLRSSHPSKCDYDPIRNTPSVKPNTSLKPLSLSTDFRTTPYRSDCRHEEKLNNHRLDDTIAGTFYLPVVVRHSGTFSRCVWDGGHLKLISIDASNANSFGSFALNFEDGVRVLGRVFGDAVRNFFLPRKVSENYLEYVKWKFLHRVFSSALQVLATQAMFRAIGIGYSRSLPSAAALNWVLKDGLGRLSRCIYTASLASAFDTNLKRVRFATSVLFSLSIGVELLTPVFPKHFLLLATIANIAKQISLSCYIATSSAVHRSFAIADNLGEVSAKAQIQTVCFDIIGLLVAASINILVRNNQRLLATLPFALYPLFSAADLIGIYQGLKHVHLQTLTKDRLEIVIRIWIQYGYVPSPAEVSKREGVNFLGCKDREFLPIRIGCLSSKRKMLKLSFMTLKSLKETDFFFICIETFHKGSRMSDLRLLLSLREGAGTEDVILGLLHACYIREHLLHDTMNWEKGLEIGDPSDLVAREWSMLMEESKRSARNDVSALVDTMSGLGWACKNVLLSTQEQERYGFVAN